MGCEIDMPVFLSPTGMTREFVDRCKAAGGQKAVERMLTLFRQELERDMALLGCHSNADICEAQVMERPAI